MSIFEYDEEKELALIKEAERNEARRLGHEEGLRQGRTEGQKESARQIALSLFHSGVSFETVASSIDLLTKTELQQIYHEVMSKNS